MVDGKLTVTQTSVGKVLDKHLREVQAGAERELMEMLLLLNTFIVHEASVAAYVRLHVYIHDTG